jgi:hypothetical protein
MSDRCSECEQAMGADYPRRTPSDRRDGWCVRCANDDLEDHLFDPE